MNIPFIKMHGLGNDFIIIENYSNTFSFDKPIIKKMSSRNFGIGCDQVLIIESFNQDNAQVKIFNNDGSEVGACGNGVRCVASYLMEKHKCEHLTIKTLMGKLKCWKEEKHISVNMGKPKFKINEIPLSDKIKKTPLEIDGFNIHCVSLGNPHGVIFLKNTLDLEELDIRSIGPKLEKHDCFIEGINIEFAAILENGFIRMKVWERGVGMTSACGSGACATLVIANRLNLSKRKNKLILDGGPLFIDWQQDDSVIMTGEVEKVFEGQFYVP